jgi:hypothetical protein
MPDVSIPTRLALELQLALCGSPALPGVEVLTPPPLPKGRYVLAKATDAVLSALKPYEKARAGLVEQHKDPVAKSAPGTVQLKDVAAFNKDLEPILEEPVTLTGVRQITREELGPCPITAFQERVLIKAGLLMDCEP